MPSDLPLACRCGHVRGIAHGAAPSAGFRFVCYCQDCQAFARFLERPDVLDAAGGTDIFQMAAGRVRLTAGTDALRSLSFSGKVLRWYAECCRTPIANTAATSRFPVVALIHSFIGGEADGRIRDEVLGPPLCRIYERSATGPLPSDAPPPASLRLFVLRALRIFTWWRPGHSAAHPFFHHRTGAPLAPVRSLRAGGHRPD